VLDRLKLSLEQGQPAALATVVGIRGSAPKPLGSSLLICSDGTVIGAVSGGCVESDVVYAGERVLSTGQSEHLTFEAADGEDPFDTGLTCGGVIQIVVEKVDRELWPFTQELFYAIDQDQPLMLATRLDRPGQQMLLTGDCKYGSLALPSLELQLEASWKRGANVNFSGEWPSHASLVYDQDDVTVIIREFYPRPPLWIFGAIDISQSLALLAKNLGFCVTVCDARAIFVTKARFPMADHLVCEWPHRWLEQQSITPQTVICVLTHDNKFDLPILQIALRSDAKYVGAMGSRKTHADRLMRLLDAGLTQDEVSRLRSPIGLDLGGRSPQETALSILAEVVMLRESRSGRPLLETQGTIHSSM
jgi:xanthine dehydrogenase accessory factor